MFCMNVGVYQGRCNSKMDFFPRRPVKKNNRMGNISTDVKELSGTMTDFTVNAIWKTSIHSAHVSLLCDDSSVTGSLRRRGFSFCIKLRVKETKKCSLLKLKRSSLE